MKLSMMSGSMTWHGYTPEDAACLGGELELDGIEWVTDCGRTAAELKKYSDDAGLPVACYTFFSPRGKTGDAEGALEDIRAGVDFALELEAPGIMIPFLPGIRKDRCETLDYWCGIMSRAENLIASAGLVLMTENFTTSDSPVVLADDFYKAKRKVPSLRLCFDSGNASGGEDELESCRRCFEDIRHVHFKDWKFFSEPHTHPMASENTRECLDGRFMRPELIGEGEVRNAEIWKFLREKEYSGYISLEYESPRYPPPEAVARAAKWLRSL